MNAKKSHITKTQNMKMIKYAGLGLYLLTVLLSCLLLLLEPSGFDAKLMIVPVVLALLIGALGFSYPMASKESGRAVARIGTFALAILFTFVGFFVVAAVAWFVGVYNTY